MKRGSSDSAIGAKTERFANCRPTKREKVVQKAGKDSLGVPIEDPKESLSFSKMVEAEWQHMWVNTELDQKCQKW